MRIPTFTSYIDDLDLSNSVKSILHNKGYNYAADLWITVLLTNDELPKLARYYQLIAALEQAGYPVNPQVIQFIQELRDSGRNYTILLNWMQGFTMRTIAKENNITEYRVHQILEKLIHKLNHCVEIYKGINYEDIYSNSIDVLNLSTRARNCLRRAQIDTLRSVVDNLNKIQNLRNAGPIVVCEVNDKLDSFIKSNVVSNNQ